MGAQTSICFFFLLFGIFPAAAQPYLPGKQVLEDMVVYPDFKTEHLFYYAPNDLRLGLESDGSPKFTLVQMRYTGRAATGDQGESRFMNMVQLTVEMPPVNNRQLQKVKALLGNASAKLRPLPIRNVEGYLITALGQEYKRLGELGGFQSGGPGANSSSGAYWTERTFTLRLNNADAQILWDQVATGKLALSVNYAFYADAVSGEQGEMELSGDSTLLSQFNTDFKEILEPDTTALTHLIKANAFSVAIDVQQYPDLLKKIDANQEQNVAYPFLEVRCYDFTNDLRPDLGAKAIEIEAIGVSGGQIRLQKERFFLSRPDENVFQIRFPFAIRLDRPLRYRISEISLEGEERISDWITRDTWVGVIDITTAAVENPVRRRLIEIETDTDRFAERMLVGLSLNINYQYRGKLCTEKLQFTAEDAVPVRQLSLLQDTDTPVVMTGSWITSAGRQRPVKMVSLLLDEYIFFALPAVGE